MLTDEMLLRASTEAQMSIAWPRSNLPATLRSSFWSARTRPST